MKATWFSRVLQSVGLLPAATSPSSLSGRARRRPSRREPAIECLEARIAPAVVYVVPISTPADVTHQHSLASAMSFAGGSGTVIVEPGAPQEPGVVNVTLAGLTIAGDPNISGASLPQYDLNVNASGVTLTNLNLGTVTETATASTLTISRSQLFSFVETGAVSGVGHNTLSHNFISGSVALGGNSGLLQPTGDLIVDNDFAGSQPITLQLTNSNSTQVKGNHIVNDGASGIGIQVRSGSDQVLISGNTVEMTGTGTPSGVTLQNTGGVAGNILGAQVLNNDFHAGTNGTGIFINVFGTGAFLTVQVEGNDLHSNKVGIDINGVTGSATGAGNTDLGGGSNAFGASKGANNFRGFDGVSGHFAIVLRNTDAGVSVQAQHNIFDAGVNANSVVKDSFNGAGTGSIFVTNALDANHAYIQSLYHDLLGRVGDPTPGGEVDQWVAKLAPKTGRVKVATAIMLSDESLGRMVDHLYDQYLDRDATALELTKYKRVLKTKNLASVEVALLSSVEYQGRINTDFAQALYTNLLDRPATGAELVTAYRSSSLRVMATKIAALKEYRLHVAADYQKDLLHRAPSADETAALAKKPGPLLQLELLVLTGDDYFNHG